jgi:DNA processing protein
MLSRDELAAWLRLSETPGVGPGLGRRLLAAFASPEAVFDADEAALRELVGPAIARALLTPDPRRDALAETTWRWLQSAAAGAPRDIVVLGDARYPARLLQTADPPLLLHVCGRVELLAAPGVAVVGSRQATPQGLENAHEFAQFLSEQALTVVSGLAQGIDGAAHEGGLAGAGSTIAFVGTGLDQVYPRNHVELARRIAENGLIASEYPLGMEPLSINFPRRNRLIAGTTLGTLVVEAALKSGSLITARLAMEAGREVFAIPGSIHATHSRGCHLLIQQGAKLVESGADILEELRLDGTPPRSARIAENQPSLFADPGFAEAPASGPDAELLAALGHDPATFDALSARSGWPSDRLSARLLELELSGKVQRLPGGLFQRRGVA